MALETYRIRIYENDNYEIEDERRHLLALDLDTPLGISLARVELAEVRASVARRRRFDDNQRERLRVSVHDAITDEYVMDALA
jgi:hypothetical protein